MKNLSLSLLTLISLVACQGSSGGGGKGGNDNGPRSGAYTSPNDPCRIAGACTSVQKISYQQAVSLGESRAGNIPAIEVGLSVSTKQEETQLAHTYNDETHEWDETSCLVSYDQVRTIVEIADKHIYVEEKKSNFSAKPDVTACNDLENSWQYPAVLIAKENREESTSTEGMEMFKNFNFRLLTLNGVSGIEISGFFVTTMTSSTNGEAPTTSKVKVKLHMIYDLSETNFAAKLFEHNTTESTQFNSESMASNRVVERGVDVSHIDISTMDPNEIRDRTYEEDGDGGASGSGTVSYPTFKSFN